MQDAQWDAVVAEGERLRVTAKEALAAVKAKPSERGWHEYGVAEGNFATWRHTHADANLSHLRQQQQDATRLLYVRDMMDGIGDVDFHEGAWIAASVQGRDEPNDADYLSAIRTAIDSALSAEGSATQ